jgi:hypothetical protein
MRMNVGLLTSASLTRNACASPLVNVVFPAPNSPFKKTISPALKFRANFAAIKIVSSGLCDNILFLTILKMSKAFNL